MTDHEELWYSEARSIQYFFYRQGLHFLLLLILIPTTWSLAAPVLENGSWLDISAGSWFWLAVGGSVLHQVLGWIGFRLQLGWAALTRLFGSADMLIWGLLFFPLLIARPILIMGLARSTQNTLLLPELAAIFLGVILLIPVIYTAWSIYRYFGFIRGMGGDHFRMRYREKPLVKEGAFQWTGNAMYTFAPLLLWAIAFIVGSQAALTVALFEHAYVWVHYFCTEKPDMKIIYDKKV